MRFLRAFCDVQIENAFVPEGGASEADTANGGAAVLRVAGRDPCRLDRQGG